MVWVQNNKGSVLPLSQKKQSGSQYFVFRQTAVIKKLEYKKIVEQFFWAKCVFKMNSDWKLPQTTAVFCGLEEFVGGRDWGFSWKTNH